MAITGTIPSSLGSLTELRDLYVDKLYVAVIVF